MNTNDLLLDTSTDTTTTKENSLLGSLGQVELIHRVDRATIQQILTLIVIVMVVSLVGRIMLGMFTKMLND